MLQVTRPLKPVRGPRASGSPGSPRLIGLLGTIVEIACLNTSCWLPDVESQMQNSSNAVTVPRRRTPFMR